MNQKNPAPPDLPTGQELLRQLLVDGYTLAQIGRQLHRDPSLLRRVVQGKTPGDNLRGSLAEVLRTGHVRHLPKRRTTKTGQPVKVRGKAGKPSVVPPDAVPVPRRPGRARRPRREWRPEDGLEVRHGTPQAPRAPLTPPKVTKPGQSKFTETTYTHKTGYLHSLTMPKSEGPGREQGRDRMMQWLKDAASGKKRVTFTATLDDNRVVPVGSKGGYSSDDVLSRSIGEGDDPLAWLDDEINGIEYYDTEEAVIIGVQLVTFE